MPLILPTIFRLVIRFFSFALILSGKVPASSNLIVTCVVNKPSSAARIAVLPSNINNTVKNRPLKVNVLIFILVILFRSTIVYYTFDILSNKSGPGSCHVEKFNVSSCCKKETKNPTIDMAKLQIKSEKPLLLEDFFSGRGANPLTLTLTVQNSATPP